MTRFFGIACLTLMLFIGITHASENSESCNDSGTSALQNQIFQMNDADQAKVIEQLVKASSRVVHKTDNYTIYELLNPSDGKVIRQEIRANSGYKKIMVPANGNTGAGYTFVPNSSNTTSLQITNPPVICMGCVSLCEKSCINRCPRGCRYVPVDP